MPRVGSSREIAASKLLKGLHNTGGARARARPRGATQHSKIIILVKFNHVDMVGNFTDERSQGLRWCHPLASPNNSPTAVQARRVPVSSAYVEHEHRDESV